MIKQSDLSVSSFSFQKHVCKSDGFKPVENFKDSDGLDAGDGTPWIVMGAMNLALPTVECGNGQLGLQKLLLSLGEGIFIWGN